MSASITGHLVAATAAIVPALAMVLTLFLPVRELRTTAHSDTGQDHFTPPGSSG